MGSEGISRLKRFMLGSYQNLYAVGDYVRVKRDYIPGISQDDVGILIEPTIMLALFRGRLFILIAPWTEVVGSMIGMSSD